MNGFELEVNACKKILEREKANMSQEEIEDMEDSIRVNEALASFKDSDFFKAFDSAAFNQIMKGYVEIALMELCDSEDEEISEAAQTISSKLIYKIGAVLDRVSAKEAEEHYLSH